DPEEETADEQGRQAAVDEPHEQGGGDRQRCHEREHGAAAEPVGERAHRDTAERAHHDRQGHHERLLERGQSESLLVGGAQRPHERPRPEGEQEPAEAQREREGGLPGSGSGRHVRAPFTSDSLSEHATRNPGLSSSWRTGLDSGTGRQTSQSLGENSSAWIRDPSTPASRKPDRTARRKPEEPQRNTCASFGTATSDRSMSPAWTAPGPVTASAPSSYQVWTSASSRSADSPAISSASTWSAGERSACRISTRRGSSVAERRASIPSIGVMPMPAEHRTTGAVSAASSTRSPKGSVTWSDVPTAALACSHEETSPTGSGRRIPRRHVPSPGAEDREYCRSWRAPSGSTTPTEVYWPARNSGSGALSGPARVSTVTDSVTSSRPTTVAVRKTSPGSTPASE